MVVLTQQYLVKDGKRLANFAVYFKGTGNPGDRHEIIGVSIDGYHIGNEISPTPDKVENLPDMVL